MSDLKVTLYIWENTFFCQHDVEEIWNWRFILQIFNKLLSPNALLLNQLGKLSYSFIRKMRLRRNMPFSIQEKNKNNQGYST